MSTLTSGLRLSFTTLLAALPLVVWAASPTAFTYVERSGVSTNVTVTSESKTVDGFTGSLPVSVSADGGAQYSVAGGAYTSATSSITAGQTLRIRHTSSSSANTETVTTVTVGDFSTPFKSVTGGADRTPDDFDFGTRLYTPPSTFAASESKVLTGFNTAIAIQAGPGAQYSVDGGNWTNANGSLDVGQSITMRHLTGSQPLAYTKTYIKVGGITGYFTTRNHSGKDRDGDGVVDEIDQCPDEAGPEANGCPTPPPDADGDGVPDASDNCPNVPNLDQADLDGDGIGDACDTQDNRDNDGDGVQNHADQCPDEAGPSSNNGCPLPPDADGDGVPDATDNCPNVANANQADLDGDGIGDACDTQDNRDTDRDGVQNHADQCPNDYGPASNNGCPESSSALQDDVRTSVEQTLANASGGMLAQRQAEAVVMEGRSFPDWSQPAAQGIAMPYPNGAFTGKRDAHAGIMLYPQAGFTGLPTAAPVREIAAYRWQVDKWVEIPVQVDERFPYFLANNNSSFGIYSGTDMELSYAWDRETWDAKGVCFIDPASVVPMADPIHGLDDDDEIVFMASDAGTQAAATVVGPAGTVGGGQEIALADPLNPSARTFVYLFRQPGGSTFGRGTYVSYTRDANADQWVDRTFWADSDPEKLGSSNTGYGPNLSGTVCRDGVTSAPSTDRFPRDGVTISSDKYKVYASGRWMIRSVQIAKPGQDGVYGVDIMDRWKGRAFQQSPDSNVSVVGFEDEQVNWEANSALIGERAGPIRAIREVWGADSGTNVTKTETYYRDAYSYRYRVRVHPIPPDGLYTSWDYNRSAMVPAPGENVPGGRYYTAVRGTGVPIDGRNDDIGNVDELAGQPAFFDVADPTLNLPLAMYNWEQVSAKGNLGSLVYLFELKSPTIGANSLAIPYYRDDACMDDGTGDDPVQRPWPGESYSWSGGKVKQAYDAMAGRPLDHTGKTFADCLQRQGAHAQHGVHFLLPPESDNATLPVPVNEIDGQQWAFAVPTEAPVNLGERYANIVRVPLVKVVRPRPAPSSGGGGPSEMPSDYASCVAMAQQGGAEGHEAAAKFTCAVIFGGGREDGDIQGPNTYIPMADGTLIATNVYVPWGCNVEKNPAARACPSILEMSGYESGSADGKTPAGDADDILFQETGRRGMPLTAGTRAAHNKYYKSGNRYVSVVANVRGTGCSAGEFDLFSRKSAEDGKYLIDQWMAKQSWSNGDVGVFGHSYSGITGAMIASTNPQALKMVSISGQIGDVYRDIVYPGGVSNYGFPLLWTGAVRPAYDYLGGTFAGVLSDTSDRQCAQNQAARSRTVADEPLIQGLTETDGPWYQERSVVNYLHNVRAPTQIVTAYQDEQTGPRGGTHVFDKLPQNLTRRLVTLNGDHGSQTGPAEVEAERRHWMDFFLLNANDADTSRRPRAWSTGNSLPKPVLANDGSASSRVLLEVNSGTKSNGHIDSNGFPLSQTQWTDFYFQAAGAIDSAKSNINEGEQGASSSYFSGSKRQFYSYQAGKNEGSAVSAPDASGADELIFALDVNAVAKPYTDTAGKAQTAFVIAGPITADLYLSSTGTDTELMVQLIDADPATGERLYLQRGVLRASHRAIESQRSQCAQFPSGGRITGRDCTLADNLYRIHRPHVNPTNIVPGQITRYKLEIFPVGHVLRAGHKLLVKVHAPSLDDNDWAYIAKTAPAINTLHHSVEYPSSIRLPVIPLTAVSRLGAPTGKCTDNAMRCVTVTEAGAGSGVPGPDPTATYRAQCHQYAAQDPSGIFGPAICGLFDTIASLIPFDNGGGSGGSGPVRQVAAAAGTAMNAAAGVYENALGVEAAGPEGRVLAGVGVVDMTPDVGFGAGQYSGANPTTYGVDPYATGKKQQKSYGVMSRLTARAIVVEGANGKRIALLKSDNYLAQDHLLRRVAQLLVEQGSSIGYDQILYGVTHAHSTTYTSTPSVGVFAFQDAFDARQFEFQARKLAAAIRIAEADLQPARMGATTVRHKVFKGQIMGPSTGDNGTPVQYPNEYGDLGLVVMRFENAETGAPIAAWINWGEHPEGLDGYDLHSGDFVSFLERFVDRDLGAPLVFSQGDVGSAEKSGNDQQRIRDDGTVCQGTNATPGGCPEGQGVWRDWNHKGYVQNERNVRFLADAVLKGWAVIGGEQPVDAVASGIKPNNYVPEVQVPLSNTFPVDYRNAFVPGPLSHPYPSVGNCRSEPTAEGNPGVPAAGLPDCARASGSNDRNQQIWETLKAEGVPLPEHYDAPSFASVEENLRLKLQAFRLGDIVLGSCACESQVDLILNFETRANDVEGDIYSGFDWACVAEDRAMSGFVPRDPQYAAACALQREKYYDVTEFPVNVPGNNFTPAAIRHMRAQIHNPADGWDAPEYVPFANSEPTDITKIKGNFTREELPAAQGYKIAVGIGHAGDYNGYTVSYREYMSHDHYRKALTAYGAHTADYMVTRLVRMAGAMKGAPELKLEPHDTLAQADEARQVAASTALGQSTRNAYEAYYAALPPDAGPNVAVAQPADIGWFKAANFTWQGGSTTVDNPNVVVQRCEGGSNKACDGGSWEFFADQTGEVQTRVTWPSPAELPTVYAGQFKWKWTANFEAYEAFPAKLGSTPAGFYRFAVDGCINDGSAPAVNFETRVRNFFSGLVPGNTGDALLNPTACKGGSSRYTLASAGFKVTAAPDTVTAVTADAGGDLAITVSAISVPRSYASVFPYVKISETSPPGKYCKECSFRPWTTGSGTPVSVSVNVGGTVTAATGSGTAWAADANLLPGQSATITATYSDGRSSRPFVFTLGGAAPADRDGDGVPDSEDAFPDDPTEWADFDGDGIGDNADLDDDNDGIPDTEDNCRLMAGSHEIFSWSGTVPARANHSQAFTLPVGCSAASMTVRIAWLAQAEDIDLDVTDPNNVKTAASSFQVAGPFEAVVINNPAAGAYTSLAKGFANANTAYTGTVTVNVAAAATLNLPVGTGRARDDVVVVAVIDSNINPYHWDYLAAKMPQHLNADLDDDLPLNDDPASWVPGYPAAGTFKSRTAINLTLNATDANAKPSVLHAADAAQWAKINYSDGPANNQVNMYWFPGTKIIGHVAFGRGWGVVEPTTTHVLDDLLKLGDTGPVDTFKTESHGIGTSSVSVGNIHGTCPNCVLVYVHGPSEWANEWVAQQDWIDLQTNSWGLSLVGAAVRDNIYAASNTEVQRVAVERGQSWFQSAGNGLANAFTIPASTLLSSQKGPDWIVTVGAIEPDGSSVGHNRPVDVSSLGSDYPSATLAGGDSVTSEGPFGGTSNATPVVAGLYAEALYRLRRMMDGGNRKQAGGVIAQGQPGCGSANPACALADGKLTVHELQQALFRSARYTAEGSTLLYQVGGPDIPDSENNAELEMISEGHGSFFGRMLGAANYFEELQRVVDYARGTRAFAQSPEQKSWMVADSICRQSIWGLWEHGYFTGSNAPARDPQWPIRTWLTDVCPKTMPVAADALRAYSNATRLPGGGDGGSEAAPLRPCLVRMDSTTCLAR